MYLPTFLTLYIALLHTATATAIPLRRATLSAQNTYLATCTTRSLTSDTTTSLLILYSGAPSSINPPLSLGTLTASSTTWAGFTRRVALDDGSSAVFESKIASGAESWAKSEIAGMARMERGVAVEEFVCFRDGESVFRFGAGLVGNGGKGETTVCRAEFWCAGLGM